MNKGIRFTVGVYTCFVAIASLVLFCLVSAETAEAKTRTYAKCQVAVEDSLWVYDTYKIGVDDFESHHVGNMKHGKKFRVLETKNGMARIKFNGKKAWIGTKNIEVVKAGYVKIEGKWKRIKPGFSFWLFIKFGETGY